MAGQPHVTDLIDHVWVRLFALDRDSDTCWLRTRQGWRSFSHDAAADL
jgi:hypothetical protein